MKSKDTCTERQAEQLQSSYQVYPNQDEIYVTNDFGGSPLESFPDHQICEFILQWAREKRAGGYVHELNDSLQVIH